MDAIVSWDKMSPFFVVKGNDSFINVYKSPKDIPNNFKILLRSQF